MCIDFYLEIGINEKEAKIALKNHLNFKDLKVKENYHKNPRTYEYWLTLGYSYDEAKEIITKNNIFDEQYFIDKYGNEEGKKRYKETHEKSGISNRAENAIPKIMKKRDCSEQEATEIYKEKHRNGPKNLSYWLDRGYTEDEAKVILKEIVLQDSPRRKEYWKHHYGMSDHEARIAVSQFQYRKGVNVSKESIVVFSKLEKMIKDWNSEITVYYGSDLSNKGEYHLYEESLDKMYYYDFTIPQLKIIIEYHGSCWHPNPILLDTDVKKQNWKQLKSRKTYKEVYNKDQSKKKLAQKNGFIYYEIWDTDDTNKKIEQIFEDIKLCQ